MNHKQPNETALYVLKKSPYGDGQQLVLYVTDKFRKGYVCFDDTNRGHMLEGKIVESTERSFVFKDIHADIWEFEEVSIQMFKEGLYLFVENGVCIRNKCNTTAELWEYFREQFKGSFSE